MSNEAKTEDEILRSYTHTYTVEGRNGLVQERQVEIRPWNLLNAPKNIATVGKAVVRIRKERPDITLSNILENWDILLQEAPEDMAFLVRNSLPRKMENVEKDLVMEGTELDGAVEVVSVIIKQNFFSPKVTGAFKRAMETLNGKTEEVEQTGPES